MSRPPLFFTLIIAVIVVAASLRFIQTRRLNAQNDATPLAETHAFVTMKRETPVNDRRSRQREVLPAEDSLRYEIWFQLQPAGNTLKMRVPAKDYREIALGDNGVLSYKGTRFIHFLVREP